MKNLTKTILPIIFGLALLSGMAGAAPFCTSGNASISAICANLTAFRLSTNSNITDLSINVTKNTNGIESINYNVSNSINANNGNYISITYLPAIVNINSTVLSEINKTVNPRFIAVNINTSKAFINATEANARATNADNNAMIADAGVTNLTSNLKQSSGILNTNITLVSRILGPITNLNLTGTYNSTKNNANSSWEGGLSLILDIVIIIIIAAQFILARRKQAPPFSMDRQITTEAQAKQQKKMDNQANAAAMLELQRKKDEAEAKAKTDKFMADPEYKKLVENMNKDVAKAKKAKLDIDIEDMKSYKALQAKAVEYGINLEKGDANGK